MKKSRFTDAQILAIGFFGASPPSVFSMSHGFRVKDQADDFLCTDASGQVEKARARYTPASNGFCYRCSEIGNLLCKTNQFIELKIQTFVFTAASGITLFRPLGFGPDALGKTV